MSPQYNSLGGETVAHLVSFQAPTISFFFKRKKPSGLLTSNWFCSGDHQNDSFIFSVMKMILLISFSRFLSCFRDFSNQLCFLCYVCFWWWFQTFYCYLQCLFCCVLSYTDCCDTDTVYKCPNLSLKIFLFVDVKKPWSRVLLNQ